MVSRNRTISRTLFICALGIALIGCGDKKPPQRQTLASRYQPLPPRQVPDYLKDTILERCELQNTLPFPVSGFGLVANLRGTGDSFAGTAVREYIRTEMIKRGFGSRQMGFENMQPEDILKDPRFAIVRVDGFIPPGARQHTRFDIYVSALDGNNTSSLSHGDLYRTDLKINGANLQAPEYAIDIWASGEGSVFVNPAYALTNPTNTDARASLRRGTILYGGITTMDRPLVLRLRQPQFSMSRAIEGRLNQRFQSVADKPTKQELNSLMVAEAQDEALIDVYVPQSYNGDWEHFGQVAAHIFLNPLPDFAVAKAKQLAEEAVKPGAPLLDISYCWEGLGPTALPFITPLMTSDKPEVAYAAARAAIFLGDLSAQNVLIEMARTSKHPFQVAAVQTLAKMPASPEIDQMLRTLLDSDSTLVRLEAYRALSDNNDSAIVSRPILEKFQLDIVPSNAPPIIYASRTGIPRIAVIGNNPKMNLPVMFNAMENRFTISSDPTRPLLSVFYRGPEIEKPVSFLSSPEAAELIARLGGEGAPGAPRLDFTYCEVVSLLQMLGDQQRLYAQSQGQRLPVAFVLQEPPRIEQTIEKAPIIQEPAPEKLGSADESGTTPGR
jgi:hypothetical protein